MNSIIIIAGFSGAGKDFVARYIEEAYGAHFVVSTTTRPKRPYEEEANPYYFVTDVEFKKMQSNKEFIEVRTYDTTVDNVPARWYYGVTKNEVKDDKLTVVVLDVVGTLEFLEAFGDRCEVIFIKAFDSVRKERCIARGDYNEPEFTRRLEDDCNKFPDDIVNQITDFVVWNNRSKTALELEMDCVMEELCIE